MKNEPKTTTEGQAPKATQVPSVGRMVHYHSASYPEPLAAIICAVVSEGDPLSLVNLAIVDKQGIWHPMLSVPFGEEGSACWSWPVYVPPVAPPESASQRAKDE